MKPAATIWKELPLDIVGSNVFGRYPKISSEQTFNMFKSDDWLVNFPGYIKAGNKTLGGQGRGIYGSSKLGKIIAVINNGVYLGIPVASDRSLATTKIATLESDSGAVSIAESNLGQIAICDGIHIYIYDYNPGTTTPFAKATLNFTPNFVSFQNSYFIATEKERSVWRLSKIGDGKVWPSDAQSIGVFAEADRCVAAIPMPGTANLLFVMGNVVGEFWSNIPAQLFPYQKNTYVLSDFGTVNAATIDWLDTTVAWVGQNGKSGVSIFYTEGGRPVRVSNDGIDFKLSKLVNPYNSYGYFARIDGHTFYIVTFVEDNLSYAFDFTTKKIYSLTDEHQNYFIARKVAFLNNTYYFVSDKNGAIYELASDLTTYDGVEIPRIRVCKTIRLPKGNRFIGNSAQFVMEMGENSEAARVDLSISYDGGRSFGNSIGYSLNPTGKPQNIVNWFGLGLANEMTLQFRFWGLNRFVAYDGATNIYYGE